MTLISLRRSARLAVLPLLLLTVACNERQVVVDSLLAVSSAAIAANQTIDPVTNQPLLSTADTGKVLTYANQALLTVQSAQSGWQATVKTGWAAFEADLSTSVKTRLKVQLAVLDAAIGAL